MNTGIQTSLLSRFDLIFILVDNHDTTEDTQRAEHILARSCPELNTLVKPTMREQPWSQTSLTKYINFVQKVFEPVVTEEAELILNTYY